MPAKNLLRLDESLKGYKCIKSNEYLMKKITFQKALLNEKLLNPTINVGLYREANQSTFLHRAAEQGFENLVKEIAEKTLI